MASPDARGPRKSVSLCWYRLRLFSASYARNYFAWCVTLSERLTRQRPVPQPGLGPSRMCRAYGARGEPGLNGCDLAEQFFRGPGRPTPSPRKLGSHIHFSKSFRLSPGERTRIFLVATTVAGRRDYVYCTFVQERCRRPARTFRVAERPAARGASPRNRGSIVKPA
jgi:hypothetical protein